MSKLAPRWARVAFVTVLAPAAIVWVTMVSGAATPAVNTTSTPLARGTDLSPGTIPFDQGTDVVLTMVSIGPGGSTGWHLHPGGAIVVVKSGNVTLYRSVGSQCETTVYTAGQAFIERPGELHDAVNTGTTMAVVYVTFPSVPVGGAARIDAPDPGSCPGI